MNWTIEQIEQLASAYILPDDPAERKRTLLVFGLYLEWQDEVLAADAGEEKCFSIADNLRNVVAERKSSGVKTTGIWEGILEGYLRSANEWEARGRRIAAARKRMEAAEALT